MRYAAAVAAVLVLLVVAYRHLEHAGGLGQPPQCPAPDHAVWLPPANHGHGAWGCGMSLTITGRSTRALVGAHAARGPTIRSVEIYDRRHVQQVQP
jgi:hypothetical protein